MVKAESLSSKTRNRTRTPTLLLLLNVVLQVLARAIGQEKSLRSISIEKEIQLLLFADDVIVYRENPKDSTKKKEEKLLELFNKFSKVAGYEINTQKSGAFLNTSNDV